MISHHHPLSLSSYFLLLLSLSLLCNNGEAKTVSCADASEKLYDKSNALVDAYENIEDYVFKNCDSTTVNDFCFWSYSASDEKIWSLFLKYSCAPQLTNLVQAYENACLKAGGRVVEVTFDIEMTGIDPWYSNQTDVVSKYSVSGSPECVSPSVCKTVSDIEEYIMFGWGTYYGATVSNLNIYQLQWDNSTTLF